MKKWIKFPFPLSQTWIWQEMKVFEKNIFVLFTQICLRAPAAHPNPLKAIKLLNNEKTKLFDLHYIRSQQSCCLIFATWWNHSQILSFWSLNSLIVLTSNDIFCVSWKLVFVNKISVNLLNSKPGSRNLKKYYHFHFFFM